MTGPDLSIVIPYYNGIKYIENTVQSVGNINCDKEIIIVDDGSGAPGYESLAAMFNDRAEVRVLHKDNGGIASARTFGMEAALGKYIFFCDQDDTVVPEVLEEAVTMADENSCDIVFWSTEMTYEADRRNRECDTVLKRDVIETDTVKEVLLRQILTQTSSEYGTCFTHLWMGLYRRELITDNGIAFKRFISIDDDLVFLMDVVSCADKVGFIPKTGYLWLQNYDSESHVSQYVTDFLNKTTDHFEYYKTVAGRAGCSADMKQAINEFIPQAIIYDSMINWAYMPEGNDKDAEKGKIMDLLKSADYRSVWVENRLGNVNPRYKVYKLLKKGNKAHAFTYIRSVYLRRVLRRKLRSLWEKIF